MKFATLNRILFLSGAILLPLVAYRIASRIPSTRERSTNWRVFVICLLIATSAGFTVVLTRPISTHPSDHVRWILDSRFLSYVQAWDCHSMWHPSRLFDENIFFPARNTMAFSENLIGNLLIFAPCYWITNNAILAYNVVTLATFLLSALTMYWLVKCEAGSLSAAAIASFVFGFAPARIFEMERFHIISTQWTPLVVLFAYKYLKSGNQAMLAGFAGFLYLQILTSLHGGIFTIFIGFIYVSVLLVMDRGRMPWRRVVSLVGGVLLVGLALMPVAVHYMQVQRQGILSTYSDPIAYSATPTSYLNGGLNHLYHGLLLRFRADEKNQEKQLFFGLVPWAVAFVAVAVYVFPTHGIAICFHREESEQLRQARCTMAIASAITVVVAFVLSLGPYLQWGHHVSHLSLPYRWLSKVLPGFEVMRVPARFAFMALFGVAILAGLGTEALLSMVTRSANFRRRALTAAITAEIVCVLFWEFNVTPIGCTVLSPPMQRHSEYHWLAAQPPGSATLELPTSSGDWSRRPRPQVLQEVEYVYASTYHWQPLINGFSSHIPQIADETSSWAVKLPAPEAVAAFRRIGLRFIVVHTNRLSPSDLARWQALPRDSGVRKVAVVDDAAIYALTPTRPPERGEVLPKLQDPR